MFSARPMRSVKCILDHEYSSADWRLLLDCMNYSRVAQSVDVLLMNDIAEILRNWIHEKLGEDHYTEVGKDRCI